MPKVAKASSASTTVKSTGVTKKADAAPKKKMTPYNQFMKVELPKYKSKNPGTDHKEAFKQVAQLWKHSPLNPKNA